MTTETKWGRSWAEVLLTPLSASLLMCLVGWRPTQVWAGEGAIKSLILAQALLLTVLYATLLPIMRRMASADSLQRLQLAFRAAGQRFILTLLAAGSVAWTRPADRRVFLVWIAVGYVTLTLAETIALVRWMKRTENRPCT